jgi:DNA-binding CsgD family transcriptional regulator
MPRRPDLIPIDKGLLQDLYWGQRLSLTEIGAKLGVHFTTVQRRMIEYGIPRRNLGPRRGHGERPKRAADVLTPGFLTATYERKGMTTSQIADETGFNRSTVLNYVRQAGIPIRPVGLTKRYEINKHDLAKLRRQGWSPREIAEHYGCSVTTVERAARRYGLVGT